MARLISRNASLRLAAAAAALLGLASCNMSLDIKKELEQKVAEAEAAKHAKLALYDGAIKIGYGGAASCSDTIFGETSQKTLTIKNEGGATLTLTAGPNYVALTGGGGKAAYGSFAQPTTIVLAPGASTDFSLSFSPSLADTDYPADLVINSDDPSYPAFNFKIGGHSTQWHGSKAVVSSATFVGYYSPQIAVAPTNLWVNAGMPTLVAGYHSGAGIYLSISTDGGKTWPPPQLAVSSTTVSAFSLGVSSCVHLFYLDSSSNSLKYTTTSLSALLGSTQPNYVAFFSTSYLGSFPNSAMYQVKNSTIAFANSYVYLAFYNATAAKLQIAKRYDSSPSGGNPAFDAFYDVTAINSQTGGEFPSLRADSANLCVTYGDGRYTKMAKIPLSTITTPGSYSYYTIRDNGSGESLWSTGLVIDGTRGYALWRLDQGSPIYSAYSTTTGYSSWSTPSPLAGESTQTISQSQTMPFVATGTGIATLFCRSGGIRFSSSNDYGLSWNSQWLDTDSSYSSSGAEVAMTASGTTVYALYTTESSSHPNKYSITLMKSLDSGASW